MIPDYQTLMLPFLKVVSDNKQYHVKDIEEILAKTFKLTIQERNELLPSGNQTVFSNRVGWARTYLNKALLIESPKRGLWKITQRGIDILKKNPSIIDNTFLKRFTEFVAFYRKKEVTEISQGINAIETKKETPVELLEEGYRSIRNSLKQEVLDTLKNVHPSKFEKIVVDLLVKMGYGGSIAEAGEATKYTNDEGIDGIIKEDKLGLDVIYIQAKRWEGTVSRPEIQKFVGALAGQRAKKGVFITTSNFSREAIDYSSKMDAKIVLIDGEQLAEYMINYNLGVSIQNTYEIKKIDFDYFEEE